MEYIKKIKYNGLCWLCNNNASDSREHKDKSSDIRSFTKLIDDSVIVKKGRKRLIYGPNSPLLKYDYVLCKQCNNKRSKDIDSAYDSFSKKYIRKLNEKITTVRFNSKEDKLNVYRYLAKNFCCRLAVNDIKISRDLNDFINGIINYPKSLLINVYSNFSETDFYQKTLEERQVPSEIAIFGRGSLTLYSSSNDKDKIDIVYSTLICNNLVFEYYYTNRCIDLEIFYQKLSIDLNEYNLPENIAKRFNLIIKNYV